MTEGFDYAKLCGWPLPHRNVKHDGRYCTTCQCYRDKDHDGPHRCAAELKS